jgi:hypothetical protein
LGERVIGAEPQRRRAPLGAALVSLLRELIVAALERLRRGLELQAIIARSRRVGAVADLDTTFDSVSTGSAVHLAVDSRAGVCRWPRTESV